MTQQQSKTVTDAAPPSTTSAQQSLQQYLQRLLQRFQSSTSSLAEIHITDSDGYVIASSTGTAAPTTAKQQQQPQQRGGSTQSQQQQQQQRNIKPSQQSSVIEPFLHTIAITCQQASKLSIGLSNTLTLNYSQYTLIVHNLLPIYVTFVVHNNNNNTTHDAASPAPASATLIGNNIAQLSDCSIYRSLCHELQPLRASIQLEQDRQQHTHLLHAKSVT